VNEAVRGVVAGGWAMADMAHATCWEVYTSTATDMQAMDVMRPNMGRQAASAHRVAVRTAGLATVMSRQPASECLC